MSDSPNSSQKTYHKKATGAALATTKKHSKEHELKLYGSCFWYAILPIDFFLLSFSFLKSHCAHNSVANLLPLAAPSPFVQRVWLSMEVKGIQYQYIEVDPYKKPESLMKLNPRGLVPTLQHGDWACYESTVLMEYVRRPLPMPESTC